MLIEPEKHGASPGPSDLYITTGVQQLAACGSGESVVHTSSHPHNQCSEVDSLKLTMLGGFTPTKLANVTNPIFPQKLNY